jgi:hypothetical protein
MEPDQYCREIESHLCRRNAGHLVRLVGPAFEKVVGWVESGIPIRVALAGIDRYFERHDAKPNPRRRPVRVEFCEADVLDAFDAWRRAVGVGIAGADTPEDASGPPEASPAPAAASGSLRAHLDRVATRLTDRLASDSLPPGLEACLERLLSEIAPHRDAARTLRGEGRQALIAGLQRLDEELLAAVRAASDEAAVAEARAAAETDLEAFRPRMAEADYARACDSAVAALLRDRWRLPVIAY